MSTNKTEKKIVRRKLKKDVVDWDNYTIECGECGNQEEMSTYAVAQHTMGNPLTFTCECGHRIDV